MEQNTYPGENIKTLVSVKTKDDDIFTIFSDHPLLGGSAFKCINLEDALPFSSKDFANIVYYLHYNEKQKECYNFLKLILPYSMVDIQNHIQSVFMKNLEIDLVGLRESRCFNNEIILFFVEITDSFEDFVEKITEKYNRDYSNNLSVLIVLFEDNYDILYDYDSFDRKFLVDFPDQYLEIIFSNNSLMNYFFDNFLNLEKEIKNEEFKHYFIIKYPNVFGYIIEKVIIGLSKSDAEDMAFYAAYYNNYKSIKSLINHGVNINSLDDNKSSILNIACSEGNYMEDISNINFNSKKRSKLCFEFCKNNYKIVKYLIDNGANVNSLDIENKSPLHNACNNDNYAIVKYLIDNGANINCLDNENKSPIHIACSTLGYGHQPSNIKIIKYLIKKGAKLFCKDSYGNKPIDKVWMGHSNVKKYIKKCMEIKSRKFLENKMH